MSNRQNRKYLTLTKNGPHVSVAELRKRCTLSYILYLCTCACKNITIICVKNYNIRTSKQRDESKTNLLKVGHGENEKYCDPSHAGNSGTLVGTYCTVITINTVL